jgi:hypothetical protein
MSECLPGCQCGQHRPATSSTKTPAEQREIILANLRNSIRSPLIDQAIRNVEAAQAYAAKFGD